MTDKEMQIYIDCLENFNKTVDKRFFPDIINKIYWIMKGINSNYIVINHFY